MRRTLRQRASIVAIVVACCLGSSTALAVAPPGYTELLVEMRAGQLARRTVFAWTADGAVLVPALELFDLVELSAHVDTLGVLDARREPENQRIGIDPQRDLAWVDDRLLPLGELAHLRVDGELFIETELAGELLGVDAFVDLVDLTVTLDPVDDLPIGRRHHREKMRLIGMGRISRRDPDLVFAEQTRPWEGATLDWTLGLPDPGHLGKTSWFASFGGSAFGGGLDIAGRGRADGQGREDFAARWLKAWPEQPWLRQLRMGRSLTTGPRPRSVDGVAISNSPFLRRATFGSTIVRGPATPGWEVELYLDGQLLGYERIDDRGYYEFEVPIDYGQNVVELRSYGPHGEVRIEERAVRVDFDRLPGGQLEYGLSGGRCADGRCDGTANFDLWYGIDDRWTVRTGNESFRREGSAPDLHHPYAEIAGSVTNAFRLQLHAVQRAMAGVRLGFEPTNDLRSGFEYTSFYQGENEPILVRLGQRSRGRAHAFWRPVPAMRAFFLGFDGIRSESALLEQTRTSWSVDSRMAGVRTTLRWNEEWQRTGGVTGRIRTASLFASSVLRSPGVPLIHGLQMRLVAVKDMSGGFRDRVALSVAKRIGRTARVEMGTGWSSVGSEPVFTLSVSNISSAFHLSANMIRSDRGGQTGSIVGEGSLLWNEGTGNVETYPFRSIGRGGISGRVFIDTNGNGSLDEGEPGAPYVRLVVGSHIVETDGYGRYAVWNLIPFEATDITLEKASLPSPLLVPAFELAQARALPNGFRKIDLPLVESVEVAGHVVLMQGEDEIPVGAAPVVLRDLDRDLVLENRCFYDGEFYFLGVPPGRYELSVSPEFLRARGLRMVDGAIELKIPPTDRRATPEQLQLRLERVAQDVTSAENPAMLSPSARSDTDPPRSPHSR